MTSSQRRARWPAAVLTAGVLAACAGSGDGRRPLLIVGVDGMEWDVALPLLAAGELPTLEGWVRNGRAGLLETLSPTQSPVIWTTVATGKGWQKHGIRGFVVRDEEGRNRLLTNRDRRAAALWNMASHEGLRTAVVGWWMTNPVEPIDGVMVAQTNTLPRQGRVGLWKGTVAPERAGQVYPPELAPRVEAWLEEADRRLDERLAKLTAPFPASMPRFERRLWKASRWSLRADAVYLATARALLEQGDFDLVMLYLGGADVIGHRFWRYWRPDDFEHPPSPAAREAFGGVLPGYYRYLDGALGRLTASLGGWNVMLLSDHGMRSFHTDGAFRGGQGDGGLSGHHKRSPPGVLVAAGPDIASAEGTLPRRRGDLPTLGTVFDIAPTALALLELPPAEDLRGRPLKDLFTPARRRAPRPAAVPTYDRWFDGVDAERAAGPEQGEEERLEQLRSLGYLDGD